MTKKELITISVFFIFLMTALKIGMLIN